MNDETGADVDDDEVDEVEDELLSTQSDSCVGSSFSWTTLLFVPFVSSPESATAALTDALTMGE